eukprot:GHVR01164500.1.p1 GENE.GHVR01164500.1~~GHVR01164500.1.p1  ORF type:complete len:153 (-),score=39.62 GHVR01164500.1:262-720(-)
MGKRRIFRAKRVQSQSTLLHEAGDVSVNESGGNKIFMEGPLLKWVNFARGWKQRYFLCEEGVLWYGSSADMSKRDNKINLSDCNLVQCMGDECLFELKRVMGGVVHLRADSHEMKKKWIFALKSAHQPQNTHHEDEGGTATSEDDERGCVCV